jgi:hypothetical protein
MGTGERTSQWSRIITRFSIFRKIWTYLNCWTPRVQAACRHGDYDPCYCISLYLPKMEAPWSLATPVRDWTLCNRDSLVLAGEDGALVVRDPGLRFRDRSPPLCDCVGGCAGGVGVGWYVCPCCRLDTGCASCWLLVVETSSGALSNSEDKSPDENLSTGTHSN